jgi:hypothetical protein
MMVDECRLTQKSHLKVVKGISYQIRVVEKAMYATFFDHILTF